ncbi:alkyl hydroperoxide reductase subunit F [Peptococcaceae bacterium CEB3]|nr:alkyl hydroperoxide reductase subunit F [Peptococcaceae bacterium CEB3]
MAKLLSKKDATAIKGFFDQNLVEPVTMRLFVQDGGQPDDCMYCTETQQIAEEVSELSDKIKLAVHKVPGKEDAELKRYDVQRVPALILEKADADSGVRFYGIPSGYEFGTLIEDLADLSAGQTKLAPDIVKQVEAVQKDVTIKVFVTPT